MAKIKIQIKTISGNVLFEHESEGNTVRITMEEAVLKGADLGGAYLRGADLKGADLKGADLIGADLGGAYLRGAKNIPQSYINLCSRDMLFVFEHLKEELPFLRKQLVDGKVDGTQYEGECACLIGTLANAKKNGNRIDVVCNTIPYYEKGLHNYGEQWFFQIRKGDTPENSFFVEHTLKLIDKMKNDENLK